MKILIDNHFRGGYRDKILGLRQWLVEKEAAIFKGKGLVHGLKNAKLMMYVVTVLLIFFCQGLPSPLYCNLKVDSSPFIEIMKKLFFRKIKK